MESQLQNDFLLIRTILSEKQGTDAIKDLQKPLQSVTSLLKTAEGRALISLHHVQILSEVLSRNIAVMQFGGKGPPFLIATLTECFRILRNCCAAGPALQDMLSEHGRCIDHAKFLLELFIRKGLSESTLLPQDSLVLLRCTIQFLGNYVSYHHGNSKYVWSKFLEIFRYLVLLPDVKITEYICMVIHSCVMGQQMINVNLQGGQVTLAIIMQKVVRLLCKNDFEWGLLAIKDCLQIDGLLASLDSSLNETERVFVLEIILHMFDVFEKSAGCSSTQPPFVSSQSFPAVLLNDESKLPCMSSLEYLARQVTSNAYNILILASQQSETVSSNFQASVIVKQIEALAAASSMPQIYPELQKNVDLFTSCIYLLDSINKLGKSGENLFSSVKKIKDTAPVQQSHPVFGLKKDLLKLIGNCCHKNRINQDKARSLHAIPLILDHTSVDKRNPFIMQWAIFAIHNIMENNDQNKAVLMGLKMEGLANNEAVLRELGIDAELKGEKIYVKPSK